MDSHADMTVDTVDTVDAVDTPARVLNGGHPKSTTNYYIDPGSHPARPGDGPRMQTRACPCPRVHGVHGSRHRPGRET